MTCEKGTAGDISSKFPGPELPPAAPLDTARIQPTGPLKRFKCGLCFRSGLVSPPFFPVSPMILAFCGLLCQAARPLQPGKIGPIFPGENPAHPPARTPPPPYYRRNTRPVSEKCICMRPERVFVDKAVGFLVYCRLSIFSFPALKPVSSLPLTTYLMRRRGHG